LDFLTWLQGSSLTGFYVAAFVLGAFHALEPGHGKTVVAAYLVGSKGKTYEAVVLGLIVTFTHTFSIIALAVIARFAAAKYTDQQLHVYLGLIASSLIIGVGLTMMHYRWRALPGVRRHDHDDDHGHSHAHGHSHDHQHNDGHLDEGHEHGHSETHPPVMEHGWEHRHLHTHGGVAHSHYQPETGERLSLWKLLALGISGGLVPCPAAFALLLAAVSAGALAKGVGLVIVFSAGLAAALVAIGIGVIKAAGLAGKFMDTEKAAPYVAMASAVLVTLIGVVTLYNSLKHIIPI